MTRKLYLHLGLAKTGTSAVQHILRDHDGSIVCYPKVGLWSDGSHHNLVLNFFGDCKRPEMVREDVEQLFARIGEEARASERNLVISSEILAGRRDIGDFIAALQRRLGDVRVELLICVREHFERAASAYNQRVKDAIFGERRDPDLFLAGHTRALCYGNLLRRLRRSGFEAAVINYHPAENCVARVLTHLGFAAHQIPPVPVRNMSLSRKALVAMLAVNRIAVSPEQRNQLVTLLRGLSGFFAPSTFIFGPEAAAESERKFALDRKFLRRQFGIRLPAPGFPVSGNIFVIDEREFEEIETVARELGAAGAALRDSLRPYVHAAA